MITDPAVQARVTGTDLPLGTEVVLRLASVDWGSARVVFELV